MSDLSAQYRREFLTVRTVGNVVQVHCSNCDLSTDTDAIAGTDDVDDVVNAVEIGDYDDHYCVVAYANTESRNG